MTTYVQFTPNPNTNLQFTATLDGQQYNVLVTWSLYARRWYLNVINLQGSLVLSKALVGSPPDSGIDLLFGYFSTIMLFRQSTQQFEIG